MFPSFSDVWHTLSGGKATTVQSGHGTRTGYRATEASTQAYHAHVLGRGGCAAEQDLHQHGEVHAVPVSSHISTKLFDR